MTFCAGFVMRSENTDNDDDFQRLKDAVGAKTDTELGQFLGKTQGAISAARTRKRIPASWIKQIALNKNVDSHSLFFGEKQSEPSPDDIEVVMVPLVNATLSAGGGSFEVDGNVQRHIAFRHDFLSRKGCIKDMVLMTVAGDSMDPEIKDKDTVLIDQSQTQFVANGIYAVSLQDMLYLKRVNARPDKIILESINPDYPPMPISPCDIDTTRVLGRAIWWCRDAV